MNTSALRTISAILLIGALCNIYIAAAPSVVGALVDYQKFSEAFAGQLISYSNMGATIAGFVAILVIHSGGWNLRYSIAGCLILVVVTSVGASLLYPWPTLLAINWFLGGSAAGLSFTVCAVALTAFPSLERSYAILCGTPFIVGAAGLAGFPQIYREFGIDGLFYTIALLNLLALPLVRSFPPHAQPAMQLEEETDHGTERPGLFLVAIILLGLFLFNAANSGLWIYFERMGVASGLSAEATGAILGPGFAAALLGIGAAGVLGDRIGHVIPIVGGTVLIMMATAALGAFTSPLAYGLGTAVFNACITFVVPYFVALAARMVPSGRGVATANFLLQAGFSAGAFSASLLLRGDDFSLLITATMVAFGLVLALTGVFAGHRVRSVRRMDAA